MIPFGEVSSGRAALRLLLADSKRLDGAVAFVTASGVQVLHELFAEYRTPTSFRIVVRGGPISDPDAVVALAELGAEVRVVMGAQASRFHPKLWLGVSPRAFHILSGSGNLTAGGLDHNHEQFELLHLPLPESKDKAAAHQQRWDAFFALGVPLEDAIDSPAWTEWVAQQFRRRQVAKELAELDRRIAGRETRRSTGARSRARSDGAGPDADLLWLGRVLQEAVGDGYTAAISRATWGRRVQVDAGASRGFKYVFLMPVQTDNQAGGWPAVRLQIYPGDTLAQARLLYPRIDEPARARIVELAGTPGWSVRPNFHLGFRSLGWLHDAAPAGLVRYLDYWHSNIDDHREARAEEWPEILAGLADQQIVPREYLQRFAEEVGRRSRVHPRPGLVIARDWTADEVNDLDKAGRLSGAVRRATDHVLAVLGEAPLSP